MSATPYGILLARYWTGPTGRALRARGGKDAQLLGAYLTSNDYANMIGLYPIKLRDISDDLQLSRLALRRAFTVTALEVFAAYDELNACVWVREMARYRLRLRPPASTAFPQSTDAGVLADGDKRLIAARRLYETVPANAFLASFFLYYRDTLRLTSRREAHGIVIGTPPTATGWVRPPAGDDAPSKSGSGSGISQQDQHQEQGANADASAHASPPAESKVDSPTPSPVPLPFAGDLSAIIRSVFAQQGSSAALGDVMRRVREQASGVSAEDIHRAMVSVLIERARPARVSVDDVNAPRRAVR